MRFLLLIACSLFVKITSGMRYFWQKKPARLEKPNRHKKFMICYRRLPIIKTAYLPIHILSYLPPAPKAANSLLLSS